jgi:hypothetical protein
MAEKIVGIDSLKEVMKYFKDREVKIGWFEGNTYSNGTPVAFAAYVNEVGGSRTLKNGHVVVLPARAPMRTTMERSGKRIADMLVAAVKQAQRTENPDQALNQFGMLAAEEFKKTFNSNLPPPNSEATIEGMIIGHNKDGSPKRAGHAAAKEARKFGQGKGPGKPTLVDSGRMLNTLTWKVD